MQVSADCIPPDDCSLAAALEHARDASLTGASGLPYAGTPLVLHLAQGEYNLSAPSVFDHGTLASEVRLVAGGPAGSVTLRGGDQLVSITQCLPVQPGFWAPTGSAEPELCPPSG